MEKKTKTSGQAEVILASTPQRQTTLEFLKVSGFHSIKTKILFFALLATIVPSLILGSLFYYQNSRLLKEKISQALHNAVIQSSGEFDLWLKECLYDLRVFASSYIIAENLPRVMKRTGSRIERRMAHDHLIGYLRSVNEKFSAYKELALIDPAGRVVVTSTGNPADVIVPKQWLDQLGERFPVSRNNPFAPQVVSQALYIAETIVSPDSSPMGYLAAVIDLDTISGMLSRQCTVGIDEIFLIAPDSDLLVSSGTMPEPAPVPGRDDWITQLTGGPSQKAMAYIGHQDKAVVGMAVTLPSLQWVMVAEMDRDNAYGEIERLRGITFGVVGGLMLCIGLLAYFFGHTLVRPLRRLSREAAGVAGGNLEVEIPVAGSSEVSYLTQVFNHMVASLRQGREEISAVNNALMETNKELHQLSITDGLTGLNNRKHIMGLLSGALEGSAENGRDLAVLMLDIDHFKKVNDTYGHLAGDGVMVRIAQTLLDSVEEGDQVGRYGGEEFLAVLPGRPLGEAAEIAERIRRNVSNLEMPFGSGRLSVTVSIGVAAFPFDGEDAEAMIRKADDALYRAKEQGRNCVVLAEKEVRTSTVLTFSPRKMTG